MATMVTRTRLNVVYTHVHCCRFTVQYVEDMFEFLCLTSSTGLSLLDDVLENWIFRWKWERRIIIWMAL